MLKIQLKPRRLAPSMGRPSAALGSALLLTLGLLLTPTTPAFAQDGDGDDDGLSGSFHIGYRFVSVDGDETKYREDINFEEGPRIFDLSFHLAPQEGVLEGLVDRVDLDMQGFGGDPYESLRLDVRRHDRFHLSYQRTRSDYFYDDLLTLPENVDIRLSNIGDLHTFDFERVRDRANLSVNLSERAMATFGLSRFTRRGESTTTLDVSRDEFELDRPIDESLNDTRASFQYRWDRATLVLEESYRVFDNDYGVFLPGFSEGESPGPATLDLFFLDQPYELTSREHRARLVARPTDRWTLRAAVGLQDYDNDLDFSETSQGNDFRGDPFVGARDGAGQVEGDTLLVDVDTTYRLSDRWSLLGGIYTRDRDQDGVIRIVEDGDTETERSAWQVEILGLEAGLQWFASPAFTLSAGVRQEERDVSRRLGGETLGEAEEETTEHTGFFASAGWRPSRAFRLTGEVDRSSYDDPYTLVSPTDRLRYRLRAEVRLAEAWSLSGSLVGHEADNDDSGFDSSYDQANLRLAYTRPELELSLGYGLLDISRRIDQALSFGTLLPIAYEAESDLIDARVRWRAGERWLLGASATLYENDGDTDGAIGLDRDDWRAFVERFFTDRWSLRLAYRDVGFEELAFGFERYDAEILEASIGHAW